MAAGGAILAASAAVEMVAVAGKGAVVATMMAVLENIILVLLQW